MSPSMLKTPSVTISLILADFDSSSFASKSFMSRCVYRNRFALDSRIPSMIEAWFKASLRTASSSVRRASKIPPLASKQLGYRTVSSIP